MYKFKKPTYWLILIIILVSISFSLSSALANDEQGSALLNRVHKVGEGAFGGDRATETTAAEIAGKVVNSFFGVLGVIFIILAIYGGYLWMTASGNEEQVKKAKSVITQAIIGISVTLLIGVIANLIFTALEYNF